jgi:hypothetical protein
MTARTPIYWDGTNLKEMTSGEITEWVTQTIYQYAADPSVTLTQVASGGNLGTLTNTRFRSSAATQQATSYATPGSLDTVSDSITRINMVDGSETVTGDTNNVLFPVYYDNAAGAIQSMTETDFVDTFIKPAIDRLTSSTEANAGDWGGTFTIHTSTTLANHTLISATEVFFDNRANSGNFSAAQIGTSGTYQDHPTTIANYYLFRRDAVDNTPSRNLLYIANATNNLNEYAEATIEGYLAEYVRKVALDDTVVAGYNIDYNINGSGNTRGTGMTDTKLDGSSTVGQRLVTGDDYRSQRFPTGSSTTINTYNLKINKS